MTDITPDFNVCLKEKGSQPVLKRELNIDKIDSFLQEAYTIVRKQISVPAGPRSTDDGRTTAYQTSRASSVPFAHLTSPPLHLPVGDMIAITRDL